MYLQIAELSHSVSSPMSFRVEYKRGSTAPVMFQRQVRFQVDISAISKQPNEPLFAITFTLLSGKYTIFAIFFFLGMSFLKLGITENVIKLTIGRKIQNLHDNKH